MRHPLMMIRMLSAVALALPAGAAGQRGNMSDASGATVGLFSRFMAQASSASTVTSSKLVISPEILVAFCVERTDAMLVYTALSGELTAGPDRAVLELLRGGPDAPDAARRMTSALLACGAGSEEAEQLVRSAEALLAPEFPGVLDVAAAVADYNALVEAAPQRFLADPPAEFLALRHALGRLAAVANTSYASERVYPDFPPLDVRYANEADWHIRGSPITVLDHVYLKFGDPIEVGSRRFEVVAEYESVWVLGEVTERRTEGEADPPSRIYVPLRADCDIELQPYLLAEPIIKGMIRKR